MTQTKGSRSHLSPSVEVERADEAVRAAAAPFPDSPTLHRLDVGSMVREQPPDVPWIVEGLAVRGALTLVSGREGEGKSLLGDSVAAGVAAGDSIAGMNCEKGPAAIVDAENGRYEIHRRVHYLGLPADGVEVYEAEGFHLGQDLDELALLLERHRPAFLLLDSLRTLWPGGDENDPAAVAAVLDPLRNLLRAAGTAGLILHHLSKREGDYRGSTAIGAAVELGFKLDRAPGDPERGDRRRLTCWKCRPAPEPDRRWIRLHVERGQVYVDQAEPYETEGEALRPQRPARDELAPRVMRAAEQPIEWPRLAEAIGRDSRDGTARRLRDDLLARGELTKLDDGRLVAGQGANGQEDGTPGIGSTEPEPDGVPGTHILKNKWLWEISRRTDSNGQTSEAASTEARRAAGIDPDHKPTPATELRDKLGALADGDGRVSVREAVGSILGEREPDPGPGDGGARHQKSHAPADAERVKARIAEAEGASDTAAAGAAKRELLELRTAELNG